MKNEEKTIKNEENATEEGDHSCPECGCDNLMIAGRCATCLECGWSLCSM